MAYGFNDDRSKVEVSSKADTDTAFMQEAAARQSGDTTLGNRISNIIAQGQSTEGNTELIDIRTGYNDTVHTTAGDAVRSNGRVADFGAILGGMGVLNMLPIGNGVELSGTHAGYVRDKNQDFNPSVGSSKVYNVSHGQMYLVSGYRYDEHYPFVVFESDDDTISFIDGVCIDTPLNCVPVYVPYGATKMYVNGLSDDDIKVESIASLEIIDDHRVFEKTINTIFEQNTFEYVCPTTTITQNVVDKEYSNPVVAGERHSLSVSPGEIYFIQNRTFNVSAYPAAFFLNDDVIVDYIEPDVTAGNRYSVFVVVPENCNRLEVQKESYTELVIRKVISINTKDSIYEKLDKIPANTEFTEIDQSDIEIKTGLLSIHNDILDVVGLRAETTVTPGIVYRVTGTLWENGGFALCYFLDSGGSILNYWKPKRFIVDEQFTTIVKAPLNASKLVVNGSDNNNPVIEIASGNEIDFPYVLKNSGSNFWIGKKIAWFGTSIPAGTVSKLGSYPDNVGDILGATVFNEAVGSSAARFGNYLYADTNDPMGLSGQWYDNFMRSLSMSSTEKADFLNNWGTWGQIVGTGNGHAAHTTPPTDQQKAFALSCCYDNKLDKYLTGGSVGQVDLYVFDHGHNEEFNGDYSHIKDLPPSNDLYNRSYFIGAMNFLITRILNDNYKAKIIFIGHYEDDRKTGVSEAQIVLADRWSFPLVKTWDLLGWSQNIVTVNGVNKTITQAWMPDNLHPHSDTTGAAIRRYADVLASQIAMLH